MANKKKNTERKVGVLDVEGVEKQSNGINRNYRFPYCGATITPENRRQYLSNYKKVFYEQIVGNEKYESLSEEELEKTSEIYAKFEVQREQKHFKAWLKNATMYKFKGKMFPVLRSLYGEGETFESMRNNQENKEE